MINLKGDKIQIRQDKAKMYKDGGEQSPHYNAGEKGEKLKQHHYYEN